MGLLEELRDLQRDLDELGDSVAAVLLEQAERCFLSWQFDAGERYMEQALNRVQATLEKPPEPERRDAASYFGACTMAVA